MNVSCPECSTQFVLDDDLVPPGGLQVQCSNCGAVFNAQRENPSLPPARSDSEWMVRQPSGNVYRLRELTTLQRWIVESKVSRDDEISRSGQKWERLGNIAELATFFQVVDKATAPEPRPLPQQTPASEPVSSPASGPEPAPAAPERTAKPAPGIGPEELLFEDAGPSEFSGEDSVVEDELSGDISGDDDELDFGQNTGRRAAVLLAIALVLAVGGATYTFAGEQIVMFLSGGGLPRDLAQTIAAAEERLANDTKNDFDTSATELESLAKEHPELPELMVAQATVLMSRAHHARFHRSVEAYAPRGMPRPLVENPGVLPDEEVVELLNQASEKLEAAGALAPKNYRVTVAQAELQTLRGNADEAKKHLKALRKLDGGPAFDPRVAIIRGELNTDPDELTKASNDGWLRARVELAFFRLESGAIDVAEKLLQQMPEHPTAIALGKIVDSRIASADADDAADEPNKPEPTEFDRVLNSAERARRSDRTSRALRLYEKALELEPGNAEALTGIGWTYIDLEETAAAIASFAQVVKQNERYSEGHMGLAEAYNQKGMRRDAVRHYRRYLELLPDGPEARVARRMIEQLK